ncbi:MAG: hypothetical protein KDB27_30870, partial [Planctomycetales bacterium]|nr:hypothetical protein [Planctomycetales bacterium]
DWNGDGDFDSSDFVYVFQLGTYVAAVKPFAQQEFAGARIKVSSETSSFDVENAIQDRHNEAVERELADAKSVDSVFDDWAVEVDADDEGLRMIDDEEFQSLT